MRSTVVSIAYLLLLLIHAIKKEGVDSLAAARTFWSII